MPDPLASRLGPALRALGVGPTDRVAVAASGGADSTALLRLLVETGQPVVALHVDHGLRPDAARDGAFVEALAAEIGVPSEVLTVTLGPGNVQAEARRARYAALAAAAVRRGCPYVATAHTATDQAETVLLALARGAGLRGLGGMPGRRALGEGVDLVRPLLETDRDEVAACLRARGWAWREDPSNARPDYARNRVRQTVLPALRAEAPGADRRIAAAAADARAALELVAGLAGDALRLPLGALAGRPEAARRAIVAEWIARGSSARRSRPLVARVAGLAEAPVGACVASGGLRVWREREALRMEPGPSAPDAGVLEVTPLAAVPGAFGADARSEVVDLDRAGGAVLRLWAPGDRIRPLGLDGSTAVADLLRERGVARADRAAVPVVARGRDVLWVVGHRLSAEVAVGPSTARAGRWTWRPGPG